MKMAKILMTGTNGAFGSLAVHAALKAGHHVAAAMRDPNGRNKKASADLQAAGAKVVEIDVTDDASVEAGTKAAIKALGGLDVLANVAGLGIIGLSEGFTSKQVLDLYDINVVGMHRMMRAALPTLRAQSSGLVINISSLLGRLALPFYSHYSATKWAVEGMTETYRAELSQFGVDVVLLEPGGFPTGFMGSLVRPQDKAALEGYGGFAGVPEHALEGFEKMLAGKPEQDPKKVAEAIVKLVEMPAGTRPMRTIVDFIGMAQPVGAMNDQLSQVQHALYNNFGSGDLLKLKVK
jgi:NAD(P)-dependent dehydrogenase (short-subunit alcohol dehydrogenase family)